MTYYMNVYRPDGQAIIRAVPVVPNDGGHLRVLLRARLENGLVKPRYSIFQTEAQALAANMGLEAPRKGRA